MICIKSMVDYHLCMIHLGKIFTCHLDENNTTYYYQFQNGSYTFSFSLTTAQDIRFWVYMKHTTA